MGIAYKFSVFKYRLIYVSYWFTSFPILSEFFYTSTRKTLWYNISTVVLICLIFFLNRFTFMMVNLSTFNRKVQKKLVSLRKLS